MTTQTNADGASIQSIVRWFDVANYFRQNADLVTCGYCFCRQFADNTRVRQAQRKPLEND